MGLIISVICLILFGTDGFIIPSMVAILLLLSISRKYLERKT